MSRVYQNSKRLYCQPNQMMYWNTMKPGVLYSRSATNAGFGLLCAGEPGKSLLLRSVTEVKRLANNYGNEFQKTIEGVFPTVTSGKPIKKFYLRKFITQSVKIVDRYPTWSAGIVPCVSIRLATSERHSPFQKRFPSITW